MQIDSLSVFFPALNEEKNIANTVNNALSVLKNLGLKNYEVMVVDDGSTDQTVKRVEDLIKRDSHIGLVSHPKNLGYGEALKTGFKNSQYPWVAFMDSDGQFNFSEISRFIEKSDQADFILGYRINRADSLTRIIGNWVWIMTARALFNFPPRDYSCGFKFIKKEAFEKTLPLEAGEKVTQIEMLVKAKRLGVKIAEVGVNHYPRKFGQPTGANLKVVLKSYIDLLKLWWKIR